MSKASELLLASVQAITGRPFYGRLHVEDQRQDGHFFVVVSSVSFQLIEAFHAEAQRVTLLDEKFIVRHHGEIRNSERQMAVFQSAYAQHFLDALTRHGIVTEAVEYIGFPAYAAQTGKGPFASLVFGEMDWEQVSELGQTIPANSLLPEPATEHDGGMALLSRLAGERARLSTVRETPKVLPFPKLK